ncbi:MAG: endolytic transglycosylase MltG [Alphaproteobacteria bacterium]|nr:endolytic transglycosylase MltG [Alphaproteobacteria bacterium]
MTEQPPKRHKRFWPKLLAGLFLLILIGAAAAGGAVYWAWERFHAPGPSQADTIVMVEKGDGIAAIARKMRNAGVFGMDNPLGLGVADDVSLFRYGVRYYEKQGQLKVGEFRVPAHASMKEVMDLLVSGKVIQYAVTLPEGRTSAMILRIVAADPVLTGELPPEPAEGALLPETYLFTRGTTRRDIIARMAQDHEKLAAALWEKRKADLPYKTLEEAIILASIVEKETGLAAERPQVASVFVNRLRKGMRLQSDPTIIYGLTRGEPLGHGLRQSELDKPNAWSTYQIDGLPPTPICNPGRASLEAVMNPPDTDYLFFVADGTGGHAFAATNAEHERNVAKWREIERQRAAAGGEGGQ